MNYESPKGKVYFNKDNHQLMQAMYHFKIKLDDKMNGGVGMDCVSEVKIEDMSFPIEKLK